MRVLRTMSCEGKNCPTVYQKDDETLVIQGYIADNLFRDGLPEGEQAVAIPISLLRELQIAE